MKTHLLLSHLENDMHCPLCSLSGVSYDELCFHISFAHSEKKHGAQAPACFTSTSGCCAGTNASVTESQKPQTPPCSAGDSCNTACEATPAGATSVTTGSGDTGVTLVSVWPEQNSTPESSGSSPGETLTAQGPRTRWESVRHCNQDNNGSKSEHSKAKQKRLSLTRKGGSIFFKLYFKL